MNDTLLGPDDEILGARIGDALSRRDTLPGDLDLGAVRAGARRRQTHRRIGATATMVALLAGGVAVLAQRDADRSMTATTPTAQPGASEVTAVAVLPSEFGEPIEVYGSLGGQAFGIARPQVDVWTSGETQIVVKTFVAQAEAPTTDISLAPATTAAIPYGQGPSEGTITQLVDQQWIQYLSPDGDRGTNVVVRGADETRAQKLFASLRNIDGVMTPLDDFTRASHSDSLPASAPAGWYTSVAYSYGDVRVSLSTTPLASSESSIESMNWSEAGSVHSIGGRQVFESLPRYADGSPRPGRSISWLDGSGVMVSAFSDAPFDDTLIDQVEMTTASDLQQLADGVSTTLRREPERASAKLAGQQLRLRGDADDVIACIGSGATEQCFNDKGASLQDGMIAPNTMDAIVDGHWVVFGYSQLTDEMMTIDGDRYTTPDGTVLPIEHTEHDGFLWYVIEVPDSAATVRTWPTNNYGGVVGEVSRPLVIGILG